MRSTVIAWAVVIAAGHGCGEEGKVAGEKAAEVAAGPKLQVSKPSRATVEMLGKVKGARALVFLRPGPVADQVVGYLADLGKQGGSLEVREVDRVIDVHEARRYKVATDELVLASGDRSERIALSAEPDRAAKELAMLDDRVGRALERLAHAGREVGLVRQKVAAADRHTALRQALSAMGFEVRTVAPGEEVAAGALAVLVDEEGGSANAVGPGLETIDRHLARGGAALIAVEPRQGASLGPLEQRLGVALGPGRLADDKEHLVKSRTESDHGLILTNGFAAHPSLATIGGGSSRGGTLFLESGYLIDKGPAPAGSTRVVTVKAMSSAFADLDGDHRLDKGERRDRYAIAVAVTSGPSRALVYADASWLSDEILRQLPQGQYLVVDAVKWLGGEAAMTDAEPVLHPATGDELTSYPARPVAASAAPAAPTALWDVKPESVRVIRWVTRDKTVTFERRAGGAWGRIERRAPVTGGPPQVREFPLAPEADALFADAARPVPLRSLGPLGDEARATYGFGDTTITVEHAGGTHTLLVGDRVFGGADRYAADPVRKQVVMLPARFIELDVPEKLAVRRAIDLTEAEITGLVVTRGSARREARREPGGDWTVTGGTADDAYVAGEIARTALRLIPVDFATDEPNGLQPSARLTLSGGGKVVDLEIFAGPDEAYWIRTPLTAGLAKVSRLAAARLLDAIAQLAPAAAR